MSLLFDLCATASPPPDVLHGVHSAYMLGVISALVFVILLGVLGGSVLT